MDCQQPGQGCQYDLTPKYSEPSIEYDLHGNILRLQRDGLKKNFGGRETCYEMQTIDYLQYEYDGNRLKKISDVADGQLGFVDGANDAEEYLYDQNGNMTVDKNKGIVQIAYNHLNLPSVIRLSNNREIHLVYDAAGDKLRRTLLENNHKIEVRDYAGGIEYKDGAIEAIYHPVKPNTLTPPPET